MSKVLPTIWQTYHSLQIFLCILWQMTRTQMRSMADGHSDGGVLGVIEHKSWVALPWHWCILFLLGMALEEQDWPAAGIKQRGLLESTSWALTPGKRWILTLASSVTYFICQGCRVRGVRECLHPLWLGVPFAALHWPLVLFLSCPVRLCFACT